jgi:predicted HAD superfamily Cof-like phosphohydrolase
MERSQRMVKEFMEAKGQPVKAWPQFLTRERMELRVRLIAEELQEYARAAGMNVFIMINDFGDDSAPNLPRRPEPDLVEVYDALVDLLYVVNGAALEHGMDLEPGTVEVHRSNMTKDGPKDAGGKITKGPSYDPPRLAPILRQLADRGGL